MDIQFLIRTIQENIASVDVGSTFEKEKDLYTALGLSEIYTADTKNTIKRYVKKYLAWKKTGKLNPSGKVSNQIIITDIVEDAENHVPEDGRAGNGGAHNIKYGNVFQDLLFHYYFDCPHHSSITTRDIINKVYGVFIPEPQAIDVRKIDKEQETDFSRLNLNRYYDELVSFLSGATSSAIESLSRKGYITYSKDTYINRIPSRLNPEDLLGITYETTLMEFLEPALIESETSVKQLQELFDAECKEHGYKPFNLSDITLMGYVKKRGARFYSNVIENVCIRPLNVREKNERVEAESSTDAFMNLIQSIVKDSFGLENMHSRKVLNRMYRYCQYVYELLGWKKVYQLYSITPIITEENITRAKDEYPIFVSLDQIPRNKPNSANISEVYKEKVTSVLAGACENSFSRIIADIHINPKEKAAERHVIRTRENPHPFDGTMPEYNEYFMANDLLVNKEHKKVFGIIDEDDYYLRKFITPTDTE